MRNKDYLKNCHDVAYQVENHGFLMLVSPEWFEFGVNLLTKAIRVAIQHPLKGDGNAAIEQRWKLLLRAM